MVSSIRHSRNGPAKRSASRVSNSSDAASQRTIAAGSTKAVRPRHPSKERGRKQGSQTKLRMPVPGRKVVIEPLGDMWVYYYSTFLHCTFPYMYSFTNFYFLHASAILLLGRQFNYVNLGAGYKYNSQLGVILKREYPGLVMDKDEHGMVLNTRPALEWADYFLSEKNDRGQTAGDRVLSEFWVSELCFECMSCRI